MQRPFVSVIKLPNIFSGLISKATPYFQRNIPPIIMFLFLQSIIRGLGSDVLAWMKQKKGLMQWTVSTLCIDKKIDSLISVVKK